MFLWSFPCTREVCNEIFKNIQYCSSSAPGGVYKHCSCCRSWRQNWAIMEYLWEVHSYGDNCHAQLWAHLSSTGRRKSICGNKYLFRGLGKIRVQGSFVHVCGRRWYLAKHLKVNCRIKEYTSKVHTSSVHRFIIITELNPTFFLYPATYLSCFRLKCMSC